MIKTKSILIIRSNKHTFHRLCIKAALYTVTELVTGENKYIIHLFVDWGGNEYVYDYSTKIQSKHNINI